VKRDAALADKILPADDEGGRVELAPADRLRSG
jgi:hypothetical protein